MFKTWKSKQWLCLPKYLKQLHEILSSEERTNKFNLYINKTSLNTITFLLTCSTLIFAFAEVSIHELNKIEITLLTEITYNLVIINTQY